MPVFRYVLADVFTDRPYGGNQLAVLPDAAGLTGAQMQAIAREFNLSETTFVTAGSAPGHWRVRIFTPGNELPFAGHPTVGTAVVLQSLGRVQGGETVLDLAVGPVRVVVGQEQATFFRDGPPEIRPVALPDAEVAGLVDAPRLGGTPFEAGYGTSFLFIPLADQAAVAAARLRGDRWQQAEARLWGHGAYVYALTGSADGVTQVHARMFAPGMGVGEDPATGSAAAALAGSLPGPADATHRIAIAQGVEMGRPSLIQATATRAGGRVTGISIGGGAVIVGEGQLTRLPPPGL